MNRATGESDKQVGQRLVEAKVIETRTTYYTLEVPADWSEAQVAEHLGKLPEDELSDFEDSHESPDWEVDMVFDRDSGEELDERLRKETEGLCAPHDSGRLVGILAASGTKVIHMEVPWDWTTQKVFRHFGSISTDEFKALAVVDAMGWGKEDDGKVIDVHSGEFLDDCLRLEGRLSE